MTTNKYFLIAPVILTLCFPDGAFSMESSPDDNSLPSNTVRNHYIPVGIQEYNNILTDDGVRNFASLPALTTLNLRDCSIGPAGARSLAIAPTLTMLNLSDNNPENE